MKLRNIAEDIKGSDEVIRKSAEALGDLIQFAYENLDPKESKELAMLDAFLKEPTPRGWERTKWVIDSLMDQSVNNPELRTRAKEWAGLKGLTSPVVTASIYDIDPSMTTGTPLSNISLSKQLRDKLKETLGPEGYVSSLADMGGKVDDRRIKELLKSTAKSPI
jgi:hypothetical protein